MRYLPTILRAGLLLSVGLLAGSGPARAAMPTLVLDRSAIADTAVEKVAYYHRPIAVPIAVAITAMDMVMATTAHMDMGVTGATEGGRNTNLNSRVQSKPVATSARSLSATGSASPLAERNPACVTLREPDFFVR